MIKEHELSDVAKVFLTDLGAIELHGEALDIDLVGKTRKNILIGLELKLRLSVSVLEQAYKRINNVNYIYVGIPHDKLPHHFRVLNPVYKHFMEYHGIGLVALYPKQQRDYLRERNFYHYEILKHAKLNRKPIWKDNTLKCLNELTLNQDGGFRSGDTITPYMRVVEEIENLLKNLTNSHHDKRRWVHIDEIKKHCRLAKKHYGNLHSGVYTILNGYGWAKKHPTKRSYYIHIEKE